MEVALVEGPAGDAFLNDGLWTLADDQVISLEQKGRLDDNGFHVGQIGGVLPAGLQALLTNKRTCSDPRRIQQHAGQATHLPLGPERRVCRFQIRQESRALPVGLEQAICAVEMLPTITADGRIRLRITPEVQHGRATELPRPDHDRAAWILQKDQPTESYPTLGWELTLGRNDWLLVGGRFDRPDSLGHRCFIHVDDSVSSQHLLVIRAARPRVASANGTSSTIADENAVVIPTPPLAMQAARTFPRATEP
jgi:hypothetical protein